MSSVMVAFFMIAILFAGCLDDGEDVEDILSEEDSTDESINDGNSTAPGEGKGCIDYEDTNDNGLYDEGEPCNDDEDQKITPVVTHVLFEEEETSDINSLSYKIILSPLNVMADAF